MKLVFERRLEASWEPVAASWAVLRDASTSSTLKDEFEDPCWEPAFRETLAVSYEAPVVFGGLLGASRESLDTSWEPLGSLLGASWGLLKKMSAPTGQFLT